METAWISGVVSREHAQATAGGSARPARNGFCMPADGFSQSEGDLPPTWLAGTIHHMACVATVPNR